MRGSFQDRHFTISLPANTLVPWRLLSTNKALINKG
jgi:hypothetical protein